MLRANSLLLYKNRPARLVSVGERLEIELESGETTHVRPKDVVELHPGPLTDLRALRPVRGEVQEAWEILAGQRTTLAELAELAYGVFTPASAWAAWELVTDRLYFEGTPDQIHARTKEEVARRAAEREHIANAQQAREAFLNRVRAGKVLPEDRSFLKDVETLALSPVVGGRVYRNPLLHSLGRPETPESAHALLLDLGVWDAFFNPYPARLGAPVQQPDLPVSELPEEHRLDLTHLLAFAVDDEGTDTPDDAVSFEPQGEGGKLWVHVADVAALVEPDSPIDLDARSRGSSLHLPEGTIHLLPRDITLRTGMGTADLSPALSFCITLTGDGTVTGIEPAITRVRVTRLSYDQVEARMDEAPFAQIERMTNLLREQRRAAGAMMFDFPEVKITVERDDVKIDRLPALRSRAMIEEAMITAGIQAARYAKDNGIPLVFSQQDPPDEQGPQPQSLSEMFALRRTLKRSRFRTNPGPHSALGAVAYTQVTSPLRRYLDLVAHQQIRAFLQGKPLLAEPALVERLAAFETAASVIRPAESLSERHWTLVYLLQHQGWRGEGIVVDKRGTQSVVILPALAWESRLYLPQNIPPDKSVMFEVTGVNLPQLDASFRMIH